MQSREIFLWINFLLVDLMFFLSKILKNVFFDYSLTILSEEHFNRKEARTKMAKTTMAKTRTINASITFGPDKNELANALFNGKLIEFVTTKGKLTCSITGVDAENGTYEAWDISGFLDSGQRFTGYYHSKKTIGHLLYENSR